MKDIAGYEGRYAITSCGKVWSYHRKKFLRPGNSRGYSFVMLYRDDRKKPHHHFVHRLVANAYIENPNGFREVNHKDENKTNNSLNNLEWCTRSYNMNYGTASKRVGEKLGIKTICIETGEIYYSAEEAARKTGIDPSHIHGCCVLKHKSAHGLHFFYYDYYIEHYEELKKKYTTKDIYCFQNGKTYRNAKEASDDTGIKMHYIHQNCGGFCKSTHGLNFKYIERSVIP